MIRSGLAAAGVAPMINRAALRTDSKIFLTTTSSSFTSQRIRDRGSISSTELFSNVGPGARARVYFDQTAFAFTGDPIGLRVVDDGATLYPSEATFAPQANGGSFSYTFVATGSRRAAWHYIDGSHFIC